VIPSTRIIGSGRAIDRHARAGYVPGQPLPDTVGTATLSATPSAINRSALREPPDVKRWLLWGTLVAASLLPGYMALRLWKQMRTNDEPAKR
jgi:hypothetical protein